MPAFFDLAAQEACPEMVCCAKSGWQISAIVYEFETISIFAM